MLGQSLNEYFHQIKLLYSNNKYCSQHQQEERERELKGDSFFLPDSPKTFSGANPKNPQLWTGDGRPTSRRRRHRHSSNKNSQTPLAASSILGRKKSVFGCQKHTNLFVAISRPELVSVFPSESNRSEEVKYRIQFFSSLFSRSATPSTGE